MSQPTPAAVEHLKTVQERLAERQFPLSVVYEMPELGKVKTRTFDTGMCIRPDSDWSGVYPPIRELVQNLSDHLMLMSGHGRRADTVDLSITPGSTRNPCEATIRFNVAGVELAAIDVQQNKIILSQAFTYPLAPGTLDRQVTDPRKRRYGAAGGFGVGFKDAAKAVMAHGGNYGMLFQFDVRNPMSRESVRIRWKLRSVPSTRNNGMPDSQGPPPPQLKVETKTRFLHAVDDNGPLVATMEVAVDWPGIAPRFWQEVVPNIGLFHDAPTQHYARSTLPSGVNYIADARDLLVAGVIVQTMMRRGVSSIPRHCKPGVYVRGLFVMGSEFFPSNVCIAINSKGEYLSEARNLVKLELLYPKVLDILVSGDPETRGWSRCALSHLVVSANKQCENFSENDPDDNCSPTTLRAQDGFWSQVFRGLKAKARLYTLLQLPIKRKQRDSRLAMIEEAGAGFTQQNAVRFFAPPRDSRGDWAAETCERNRNDVHVFASGDDYDVYLFPTGSLSQLLDLAVSSLPRDQSDEADDISSVVSAVAKLVPATSSALDRVEVVVDEFVLQPFFHGRCKLSPNKVTQPTTVVVPTLQLSVATLRRLVGAMNSFLEASDIDGEPLLLLISRMHKLRCQCETDSISVDRVRQLCENIDEPDTGIISDTREKDEESSEWADGQADDPSILIDGGEPAVAYPGSDPAAARPTQGAQSAPGERAGNVGSAHGIRERENLQSGKDLEEWFAKGVRSLRDEFIVRDKKRRPSSP